MNRKLEALKERLRSQDVLAECLPPHIQVHELVGSGGQGVVFSGVVNNQPAAIKVYFPGQNIKRIQREIDALTALRCPSIVRLLDSASIHYGEFQLPVVATDLIEGNPLDEILGNRSLTPQELSVLASDVSNAISELWKRRIVHRDLKPSNIILTPGGRALVIDLGLARHMELSPLTAFGITWGTRGYLSPEQCRASRLLTCKSDVYALGILLLEAGISEHPTAWDQEELLMADFHLKLPERMAKWEHNDLLRQMLNPQAVIRPMPQVIMDRMGI